MQVGQHDVNRRPSLNTELSGNKSDKNNEKCMSRTKVKHEIYTNAPNQYIQKFWNCSQLNLCFCFLWPRAWNFSDTNKNVSNADLCLDSINALISLRQSGLTCLETIFSAKSVPPPPPVQSETPPSSHGASSVFKFGRPASTSTLHLYIRSISITTICMTPYSSSTGFGNRFGKPKGPRNYPETWVWGSHASCNI